MTVHVTFPLNDADKAALDLIAQREKVSVERLMARLVRDRLDHEKWLRAEIEKGVKSAATEPLIEHESVFAAIDGRLAARHRR